MAAFGHTFGLLEHDVSYAHVALGRLVECRRDNLGLDAALHIGDLLGALVDEQHHQVHIRMIVGNGVGNFLKQSGFTRLGLCHDQAALTLSDGGEKVDDARRKRLLRMARQLEFLLRKQRRKALEGNAVANIFGIETVDFQYFHHRKIFFNIARRTDSASHRVAGLEAIVLYLLLRQVDIVGRSQIVVIRRAEETESVGRKLQHAFGLHEAVHLVGEFLAAVGAVVLVVLLFVLEILVLTALIALLVAALFGRGLCRGGRFLIYSRFYSGGLGRCGLGGGSRFGGSDSVFGSLLLLRLAAAALGRCRIFHRRLCLFRRFRQFGFGVFGRFGSSNILSHSRRLVLSRFLLARRTAAAALGGIIHVVGIGIVGNSFSIRAKGIVIIRFALFVFRFALFVAFLHIVLGAGSFGHHRHHGDFDVADIEVEFRFIRVVRGAVALLFGNGLLARGGVGHTGGTFLVRFVVLGVRLGDGHGFDACATHTLMGLFLALQLVVYGVISLNIKDFVYQFLGFQTVGTVHTK